MLVFRDRVSMDTNLINYNFIQRFITSIDWLSLHNHQCLKPINDLPKDRVDIILMTQFFVGQEKLAFVCIGPIICHP